MSEGASSRQKWIAVGLAGAAFALAVAALVVVLVRGGGRSAAADPVSASGSAATHATTVVDRGVTTADFGKLRDRTMIVPAPDGLKIADAALARALGLEPDDIITAVAGRKVQRYLDFDLAMVRALPMDDPVTIYVELARNVIVRWHVDTDARTAWFSPRVQPYTPPPLAPLTPPAAVDPFATPRTPDPVDPLVASIERVDDTHARVPRATVDKIIQDPMTVARGARVVPSFQNGVAMGFKLYAIRPSSVFARLGFENGDTLMAVNGMVLTSADKALEAYTKLRSADHFEIELQRRGRPITLTVDIR